MSYTESVFPLTRPSVLIETKTGANRGFGTTSSVEIKTVCRAEILLK